MATIKYGMLFQCRSFSVFGRTPVVCAGRKQLKTEKSNHESLIDEPKKPLTPFVSFMKRNISELKDECPDATLKSIVKLASSVWNDLPKNEKEKYKREYEAEYKKYIKNMYEYYRENKNVFGKTQKQGVPVSKIVLKAQSVKMGKPVRPKSALLNFSMQHAMSMGKRFAVPGGISEGKQRWLQLSDAERQKYIAQAKREWEIYQEELDKWERKMIDEGHDLLVRSKSVKELKNVTVIDPAS